MKSTLLNARNVLALTLSVTATTAIAGHHSMAPDAVAVPDGNKKALTTTAVGTVAWECKKGDKGAAWAFAGPAAVLSDKDGKPAISYYGPPATWEAMDGSKVTGKQISTAPAGDGNIPYQLVKANASEKDGWLKGTTYIQRLNLKGGAAPKTGCDMDSIGEKVLVAYTGEYVFWKAK